MVRLTDCLDMTILDDCDVKPQTKTQFLSIKLRIFAYKYVLTFGFLGAQKSHLNETVLLSTHNVCFG